MLRLIIIIITGFLVIIALVFWILSIVHFITGSLSYILPIVFTALPILLTLFQMASPAEKPKRSQVKLFPPSLEPYSSPYEQTIENGKKTIRFSSDNDIGKPKNYADFFPVIDFKFQNSGDVAAFLRQFDIEILQAEIDVTPVLAFQAHIEEKKLQIKVSNNGWGAANDCHIFIDDPILNRLFEDSIREYSGNIRSGENQKILSFTKELVNPKEFRELSKDVHDLVKHLENPVPRQGIIFDTFTAKWDCKDDKNNPCHGEDRIRVNQPILLTSQGFLEVPLYGKGAGFSSDFTYIALIDPLKGPYIQSHSISREIPPNGLDRFHILVASPMSCCLSIRFKFLIDKSTICTSEELDLNIRHPRNAQWYDMYKRMAESRREY